MPSAPTAYSERTPLPRRALAVAVAVAVNAAIILMLLGLAPDVLRKLGPGAPTIVSLLPEAGPQATPARKVSRAKRAASAAAPAKAHPLPPTPEKPPPPAPTPPLNMILLSREDYAASDISKLAKRAPAGPPADSAGKGQELADAGAGKGQGPGGERYYDVDWYQRPTDAQMNPYLRGASARSGWGEIVCRMVANYRVEDCRELNDSPSGSGFARALRQAAWQFRVQPPRVGGKAMLGTWVRIHFDFLPVQRSDEAGSP